MPVIDFSAIAAIVSCSELGMTIVHAVKARRTKRKLRKAMKSLGKASRALDNRHLENTTDARDTLREACVM